MYDIIIIPYSHCWNKSISWNWTKLYSKINKTLIANMVFILAFKIIHGFIPDEMYIISIYAYPSITSLWNHLTSCKTNLEFFFVAKQKFSYLLYYSSQQSKAYTSTDKNDFSLLKKSPFYKHTNPTNLPKSIKVLIIPILYIRVNNR